MNGELLYYNITTEYTDPVNTKNIPELDDNFTRINITDKELILLKNLWYEVNFTVTVIPYTLRGFGPPASTTFYLIPGKTDNENQEYKLLISMLLICRKRPDCCGSRERRIPRREERFRTGA